MAQCSICLDNVCESECIKPSCGHMFHNSCLSHWLLENDNCPMCRHQIGITKPDLISEYLSVYDDMVRVTINEQVLEQIVQDKILIDLYESIKILIDNLDIPDSNIWVVSGETKVAIFRCQSKYERLDVCATSIDDDQIDIELIRIVLSTNNRKILNKVNKTENWKIKNKKYQKNPKMLRGTKRKLKVR